MTKSMKYLSSLPWSIGASIILSTGCSTTSKHIEVCEPVDLSHVCPEEGHGPCPFCPPVFEDTIPYRYEVRIINPSTNEVLHTTNEYNDAYEYVVDYSSAHSDLIIYDLKTGEFYEETP